MAENYFIALNSINVNDKVEKKNGLTYLSWAYAWGEVKKLHPSATYTIYENADGWNYHTDGRTCWVKTGVTIEGIEHIEQLPVMDHRNNSIPLERVTSFDVNKSIQRSLTKAVARHGLGLYIYAGEDLPEEEVGEAAPEVAPKPVVKRKTATKAKEPAPAQPYKPVAEEVYWKLVESHAKGVLCPSGMDCRTKFVELTHPGEIQLKEFDRNVENVKAALMI